VPALIFARRQRFDQTRVYKTCAIKLGIDISLAAPAVAPDETRQCCVVWEAGLELRELAR